MGAPIPVPRLYAIADAEALGATAVPEAVAAMAEAGVGWIQIRAKRARGREIFRWVEESCRRLEGSPSHLWVDDRVDVAALLPVAGVHLGVRDLPPREARAQVGDDLWIGLSTHDRPQLEQAAGAPEVDVVAVGPVFATTSKENPDPVVGLELVRWARERTAKPLVAIGGIDAGRVAAVLEAGADAAVALGAACAGNGPAGVYRSCRALVTAAEAA